MVGKGEWVLASRGSGLGVGRGEDAEPGRDSLGLHCAASRQGKQQGYFRDCSAGGAWGEGAELVCCVGFSAASWRVARGRCCSWRAVGFPRRPQARSPFAAACLPVPPSAELGQTRPAVPGTVLRDRAWPAEDSF